MPAAFAILLSLTLSFGLLHTTRAGEIDEVSKLHRAGQHEEALKRAERFLTGKPRDAQMRFLKGALLADGQRHTEALDLFLRLTEDFPELAEPYNNLAVLYARQGQFEKARAALEVAVRNNPADPVAQENLGDIYALLASQAYARAASNDPASLDAPSKLALIRQLLGHRAASGTMASSLDPTR